MQGEFSYIDEDFNVRTVWDSNEIPMTAIEIVGFNVSMSDVRDTEEERIRAVEASVEFARLRRLISGEDKWMEDLDLPDD